VSLLLNCYHSLFNQPDFSRQELSDFGVNVEFELAVVLNRISREAKTHKIIEEGPLMRVELRNLHQRYHLHKFKSSPMQIKPITVSRLREDRSQQEEHHLPECSQ
jgi:hypothetical protein